MQYCAQRGRPPPLPLWLLPELQRVCDTWDLVRTDLTGTMVACHVVP
jgi:hypothetical protein